ncbi:unnamed protein product [Gongylonema pulchrum]|uniref:E3 ubiquitin-protein ligase n=1 Tax=Gongylonema pulchrum TaxID=637853 RepID=A0A183E524_9BILA|nr:unnamed protein product [Gongylonema pulchrum]
MSAASSSAAHSPHEGISPGSSGSASAPASAQASGSRTAVRYMPSFSSAVVGPSYSTVLMQSSGAGPTSFVLPMASSTVSVLNHQQREKVRQWIRKEAEFLINTYFPMSAAGADGATSSLLARMTTIAAALVSDKDVGSAPLTEFKTILLENDVSAFEMNHSGVLTSLCTYLTSTSSLHQPPRKLRLKRFAAVFMSLHPDNLRPADESECWAAFETLVTKLLASVAQHEHFQVKVTDMGGILTGSTAGSLRGAQALRFFQTHQIRCNLRRHPSCRDLKEWRHGHGSIKEGSLSGSTAQPNRIEILINDERVPGHMSILQALRQYGQVNLGDNPDQLAVATGLWVNTHTLYYRAAAPVPPDASSSLQESAAAAASGHKAPVTKNEKREKRTKIDEKLWIDGEVPARECPLDRFLTDTLPVDIDDACVPSLVLLRCLYALNRFWWTLFDDEECVAAVHPLSRAFHSSKLNAKVGRQLSDFLSVATQQIPKWIGDLIKAVAMLEVGFEGEAGTGFGPTLEFYSTVSREIQKASLRLWHGTAVAAALDGKDGSVATYTTAKAGLYPAVCSSLTAKQRDARLKKFEFIGRLLAQALIDARMLDIPLNPVFFKWLCGDDKVFGLDDLEIFDKYLYQSLRALILTDPDDFNSLEQVRLFVVIKVA